MYEYKQVIVIRKDLKMRTGKAIAQGCHASLGAVLMIQETDNVDWTVALDHWLAGPFAKICVSVDSEEELLILNTQLLGAKIPVKLITDSGLTEFHGVPTKTCLAAGPWKSEALDVFTGKMKLL